MFQNIRIAYIVLFLLAAILFIITASLGTFPWTSYLRTIELIARLPAWVVVPLLWSGSVATKITIRRIDRPFIAIRRIVYLNRYWLLRGVIFIAIIYPLARAITSYKSSIKNIVPFYADPYLARADRIIFGVDPWRITHKFIGPLGTTIIDRVYLLWFLIMMLMMGWLCFTRNQKLQVRGLITYVLSWGFLGSLGATIFSSVGPCFYYQFYKDSRFNQLIKVLHDEDQRHPLFALKSMRFLTDASQADAFGSGISAMPSMHVAIAFMVFLVMLQSTRKLWPRLLAFAFAMTILLGSVHLGWHYAVDGIVSIIGVTLIWIAAGRFVDWVEARGARTGIERETRGPLAPAGSGPLTPPSATA